MADNDDDLFAKADAVANNDHKPIYLLIID